jgi:hypothetical protein
MDSYSKWIGLLLDADRKLFAVVLAMDLGLSFAFLAESCFLGFIEELPPDEVVVVALPVSPCGFSLHNFVVGLDFGIVVLDVLVGHNVVFPRHIKFLELVFLSL